MKSTTTEGTITSIYTTVRYIGPLISKKYIINKWTAENNLSEPNLFESIKLKWWI